MIKIENVEVTGWKHALRGMRNPKNSWSKSDSLFVDILHCEDSEEYEVAKICGGKAPIIKDNDHKLAMNLANGGPVHAKYRRMIVVYADITAPLYWWKEFDTYKVGTVANSCSTMHKIHSKEFTLNDFSHEHLFNACCDIKNQFYNGGGFDDPTSAMQMIISLLNFYSERFNETGDKTYWWQMIQLLPTSYNQKRTVMLNYEVLVGIYKWRKDHKLDEWREFCEWIKSLPYSEIITGEN